jgi:hypothetical protein
MEQRILTLGNCTFEICASIDTGEFLGIGVITLDGVHIRSGRLPLSPYMQTFSGHSLKKLQFADIMKSENEIKIKLRAVFTSMPVKINEKP